MTDAATLLALAVKREREACARAAQRYIANMGSMTADEAGRGVAKHLRARAHLTENPA